MGLFYEIIHASRNSRAQKMPLFSSVRYMKEQGLHWLRYERVGRPVFSICEKYQKGSKMYLMTVKKSLENFLVL